MYILQQIFRSENNNLNTSPMQMVLYSQNGYQHLVLWPSSSCYLQFASEIQVLGAAAVAL